MCWKGSHMIWVGSVVIPFIIIWGLGIPCLAFFLIRNVKSNLDDVAIKEKYGFIYNGYKSDKYYWELIIMYRKIIFIFIAVFLREGGIWVQVEYYIYIYIYIGSCGYRFHFILPSCYISIAPIYDDHPKHNGKLFPSNLCNYHILRSIFRFSETR